MKNLNFLSLIGLTMSLGMGMFSAVSNAADIEFHSWGAVVDQSGNPVSNASGRLCVNSRHCTEITTDQNGQFRVDTFNYREEGEICFSNENLDAPRIELRIIRQGGGSIGTTVLNSRSWHAVLEAGDVGYTRLENYYCRSPRSERLRVNGIFRLQN